MSFWKLLRNSLMPALLGCSCLASIVTAQSLGGWQHSRDSQPTGRYPVRQVQALQEMPVSPSVSGASGVPRVASVDPPFRVQLGVPQPNEHPLMPALRWAQSGLKNIQQNIHDYSATMVKRERVNGTLSDPEYMFIKVRHKPLSVYMYFLDPPNVRGQEVIWVENQNDGRLQAHGTGVRKVFGTVSLEPTSPLAMKGNRYPITEIGMENLVRRLIEVGEKDSQYGECEVNFYQGAKINGRSCTCIQVVHPVPRRNFLFHVARIFVDDELNVPIRYEAHDWPAEKGGAPVLIEEYTYLNVKINNNFTDADFDIRNPNYGFKQSGKN